MIDVRLIRQTGGIDQIAALVLLTRIGTAYQHAGEGGIDAVGSYDELPDDPHLLSRQSIDWAAVWSELIKEDARHSNPRAFYWFGFDRAGFRFDIVSPAVTESERARIAEAEQAIRDGFEPFSGVIYDNEGNLRCHEGETVSDTALREEIDWLAEGVVVYDE